ncbi:hypothetical protein LTR10_016388 [Elasticomyces elasticus]|uniref:Uncharacterized protein n=1 Tax=Exophiala sideris TaxID=1016849 RepID=A0ABR0J5U5_9EURO|nr:hypothetical protein LTR10_016388 [Elasticomyces elasticus]KAK5028398.1 hypothetical protein LTS07_006489 [Exophiala sideris]KAK5035959.1 hypothetical protein LTR13_005529 [Exophiala sideris]KAK5056995.1 hypothetical protein LTR69_007633 [Exophiala sideris]KAK5181402.1 hypothetical protein LTR44_006197 [Eurotiomycetes sp. CCFEE 6388]
MAIISIEKTGGRETLTYTYNTVGLEKTFQLLRMTTTEAKPDADQSAKPQLRLDTDIPRPLFVWKADDKQSNPFPLFRGESQQQKSTFEVPADKAKFTFESPMTWSLAKYWYIRYKRGRLQCQQHPVNGSRNAARNARENTVVGERGGERCEGSDAVVEAEEIM